MSKNSSRILAIDPGTRHMGVSLIEKGKILYQGVKVIKKQNSPHATLKEGRRVILRVIHDLKPEILVLEKAFFCKKIMIFKSNFLTTQASSILILKTKFTF